MRKTLSPAHSGARGWHPAPPLLASWPSSSRAFAMQQQPYPLGRFHAELAALEPRFAAALAACTLYSRRYLPGDPIMRQGSGASSSISWRRAASPSTVRCTRGGCFSSARSSATSRSSARWSFQRHPGAVERGGRDRAGRRRHLRRQAGQTAAGRARADPLLRRGARQRLPGYPGHHHQPAAAPHRLQYRLRAVARAPAHPMLGSRKRVTRRRALAPRSGSIGAPSRS